MIVMESTPASARAARLALDGGRPVRGAPLPPRIMFDEAERDAALRVIEKSMRGWQALDRYEGLEVESYEKEFASFFGVKHATATSSGTAAIHAALAALRLEPGSEVVTTPITDPGSVAPILFQQCVPVFADVDRDTLNLSASGIERVISAKTRAILVVHLAGQPADMDAIMALARKRSLWVIEDCAQAHGARFRGKPVGSFGDIGAFSLMASKHMTSGGQGGMVLTDDEELYWQAKRFADRGKPFNSTATTNLFLGLNYRMTELEAAIGREQLKKLPRIIEKRQWIYREIKERFERRLKAFRLWRAIPGAEVNPWFCFVRYDPGLLLADKTELVRAIEAEGIGVGSHYVTPMYEQEWIAGRHTFGESRLPWSLPSSRVASSAAACPNAEEALSLHITLNMHEGWSEAEIRDTVEAFHKVESHYLKVL